MLGVNVTLHHDAGQLESGDIFLFNHFARFETFIPQFFIYEQLGAYSRAIASSEFFESDDALSSYLRAVGACLLYTSPSPRDQRGSRMPSSA